MTGKALKLGLVFALLLLAWLGLSPFGRQPSEISKTKLWAVRRGNLHFTASDGGTLQAAKVERIRSRVQGSNRILYIVPEGTVITEQDVADKTLLVRLDSSTLDEKVTRQEITYQNALAALIKAKGDVDIQKKVNASDMRSASLQRKFAHMEFEQYLGRDLAPEVGDGFDFASLPRREELGGKALEKLTDLNSKLQLAEEELQRAQDTLDWTRKLQEKGYATRNELVADELALKRRTADLRQARLSRELFLAYELPKEAESKYANWLEKELNLARVETKATSELAQATAKMKSQQAVHDLEKSRLDELRQQLDACEIYATQPGLVVYATSTNRWRRRDSPIEVGSNVHQNMELIHLPDLDNMIAEIKLHESTVKRVKVGQTAVITVDAFPDLRLIGSVTDVAGLPDPQHWLQDVQVYTTRIELDDTGATLKPGMSCRAEISTADALDVLYVPLQAVTNRGMDRGVYVLEAGEPVFRPIQPGRFDERYLEVVSGLREGEEVLLDPPLDTTAETDEATPAAPAGATSASARERTPDAGRGDTKPRRSRPEDKRPREKP